MRDVVDSFLVFLIFLCLVFREKLILNDRSAAHSQGLHNKIIKIITMLRY